MNRLKLVLVVVFAALVSACATVSTAPDLAAAPQAWVDAFNSHSPDRILALYDEEAVLWGTRSNKLATDRGSIRQYFSDLSGRPNLKITLGEHRDRIYGDTAVSTGYYTVSDVRDGKPVTMPARFSFTYRLRSGRWLIVDHHSSALPAPPK